MKTVCYLTGTSTGIGKAIAERLLHERVKVYGYGRKCTVKHTLYTHIQTDLRDLSALISFSYPREIEADRYILINNAGIIGEIRQVGKLDDLSLPEIFQVNLTAPAILINRFLAEFNGAEKELIIINISSGAAKYPVPSWSGYCSSKAGIDMLSEVVALEQRSGKVRIHSVAPGIVDTPMQDTIRSTDPEDFERVSDFKAYKKNDELVSPPEVASGIWHLINDDSIKNQVLISFRDYPDGRV